MTEKAGPHDDKRIALAPEAAVPRVTRSAVPPGKGYREYRQFLRHDFLFSCGYCAITEAEATAVRLTIDHYEPSSLRRDLEHVYSNLIYACDPCNMYKGDVCPPPAARAQGLRFFKPDEDVFAEHFKLSGIRLESKTKTGEFSIERLELNRQALRRLRELRMRLTDCDKFVAEGIAGLRRFPIDRLPPHIKGRVVSALNSINAVADRIAKEIDEILKSNARSDMIDDDPEAEARALQRAATMKGQMALFPGDWRAPRRSKTG